MWEPTLVPQCHATILTAGPSDSMERSSVCGSISSSPFTSAASFRRNDDGPPWRVSVGCEDAEDLWRDMEQAVSVMGTSGCVISAPSGGNANARVHSSGCTVFQYGLELQSRRFICRDRVCVENHMGTPPDPIT